MEILKTFAGASHPAADDDYYYPWELMLRDSTAALAAMVL